MAGPQNEIMLFIAMGFVLIGIYIHSKFFTLKNDLDLNNFNSEDLRKRKIFYLEETDDIIEYLPEYDPDNKQLIKQTYYNADGQTINFITTYEYHPLHGYLIKSTHYSANETINFTIQYQYDTHTKKLIKKTYYNGANEIMHYVREYDAQTGHQTKITFYNHDGQIANSVYEYDKNNGYLIQKKAYNSDGSTLKYILECDPTTECFKNIK